MAQWGASPTAGGLGGGCPPSGGGGGSSNAFQGAETTAIAARALLTADGQVSILESLLPGNAPAAIYRREGGEIFCDFVNFTRLAASQLSIGPAGLDIIEDVGSIVSLNTSGLSLPLTGDSEFRFPMFAPSGLLLRGHSIYAEIEWEIDPANRADRQAFIVGARRPNGPPAEQNHNGGGPCWDATGNFAARAWMSNVGGTRVVAIFAGSAPRELDDTGSPATHICSLHVGRHAEAGNPITGSATSQISYHCGRATDPGNAFVTEAQKVTSGLGRWFPWVRIDNGLTNDGEWLTARIRYMKAVSAEVGGPV